MVSLTRHRWGSVFIYRGIGLIAREIDGAKQYYQFNFHGDVWHRLDANGNILKTYKYDAFGNEQGAEPLDTNPFRYCGEYFDREIGTYYLRARNYDPLTGRFTTEDVTRSRNMNILNPTGNYQNAKLAGGIFRDEEKDQYVVEDPLGLNYYTYCLNSPVVFTDSTGNIPKWLSTVGGLALEAGAVIGTVALLSNPATLGVMAVGAAIGTIAGAGTNVFAQYAANGNSFENFNVMDAIISGTIGGISAAIGFTGAGKWIQGAANGILSGIGSLLQGGNWKDVLGSTGLGFLAGLAGGAGTGFGGLHFWNAMRFRELLPAFLGGLGRSTFVSNIPTTVKFANNHRNSGRETVLA